MKEECPLCYTTGKLTPRESKALKQVYDYLIHDERKHYWENSDHPVNKHIYLALRDLTYLATGKRNKPLAKEAEEYGL